MTIDKTFVRTTIGSSSSEFKVGDIGYVDGYVQDGDSGVFAVVVFLDKPRLRLVEPHYLEPIAPVPVSFPKVDH